MARVSTYLTFTDCTEKAFEFYRSVFKIEYAAPIFRFKDAPSEAGQPAMPESEANLVLHVCLPILGGHMLMGSDAPGSCGFSVQQGNNVHINLEPDTREETERLFKALSEGGSVETPLQDMFWGAYFASFTDRFGIRWMLNCANKA